MESFSIARPVGGGSPQKSDGLPLAALHPRRCSSECAVPPLEIGIQAVSLSPYHAALAGRYLQRLPVSPAFPTGSCPLGFHPQVSRMTQKHSSKLLLTASGIQHRVPRRTLSPHTAPQGLATSAPSVTTGFVRCLAFAATSTV